MRLMETVNVGRAPTIQDQKGENSLRWLVSFIITGAFAAIQIQQALSVGYLALPTTYDDISYYADAASWVRKFHETGIYGVWQAYFASPPHAPLSTFLGFVGFSLFGMKYWVGPVANAIVLLLFLRAYFWVTGSLPLGQAALLAIALLGAPLAGLTLMEFRPDMICSLIIGAGILFVVTRTDWVHSRRDQFITGLLFGAALWAKPTVLHLTAALFGVAVFLQVYLSFIRGEFLKPILSGLYVLVIAVIISAPYYVLALPRVMNYIWTTVYGSEASIWVRPLPFWANVTYYLNGPLGQQALGGWLYIGMGLAVAAFIVMWRDRDRRLLTRAALSLGLVVITYLAVTIPSFKGPHGLPFAATFLIATALACAALLQRINREIGWLVCIGLVALSASQFGWPFSRSQFTYSADYAKSRWERLHQTLEALGKDTAGKTFYQSATSLYLNHTILAFEILSRGGTPPIVVDVSRTNDVETQLKGIRTADIVFTFTPDAGDVYTYLPTGNAEFLTMINQAIQQTGRFDAPIRIVDPVKGGAALIYKALPEFGEFQVVESLGDIEGPYAHWGLPRVRWGRGDHSKLIAKGPAGSKAKLIIQARTVGAPDQKLTVVVNGTEAISAKEMTLEFTPLETPVEFDQQGNAEIILRYGTPSPNAVLFKTLIVR